MPQTAHTIVLVEDDTGLRCALERVLEIAGYRVESYFSAEDALATDLAGNAECIVCDVNLPGKSGFALCRALSGCAARVPIIFITAFDGPAVRAESAALGAANYLTKPFSGRTLIDAVRAALPPA